jgi:alpha-ribazole phosphatase
MNDIYLIRHTAPDIPKGICYGQSDIGITDSFDGEASAIGQVLPAGVVLVYSSPLRRCTLLAERLFPGATLLLRNDLMEIHCGEWEMRGWDDLPKEEVDPWMADFVNVRIPGGESYVDLHRRVTACWEEILAQTASTAHPVPDIPTWPSATIAIGNSTSGAPPIAIVTHGGVIRSILCGITGTPLVDSFGKFGLHYGCVIRVRREGGDVIWSVLHSTAPAEKEQHKPSSFYKK